MSAIDKGNLFDLSGPLAHEEMFQALVPSDRGILIERIVSRGQTTPEGAWYDQDRDEWVALLQGEALLAYDDGTTLKMNAGDYVLIPAHCRHRVEQTSVDPPCIWIAVHGNLL
jgi:cupin 2 domain-containing protein